MCKVGKLLKLCRCSDELNATEPYWILSRLDIIQPSNLRRVLGSPIFPSSMKDDLKFRDWVKYQINNNECFDFSYKPNHGDKLIICIDHHNLKYIYDTGEGIWIEDRPFGDSQNRSVGAEGYIKFASK